MCQRADLYQLHSWKTTLNLYRSRFTLEWFVLSSTVFTSVKPTFLSLFSSMIVIQRSGRFLDILICVFLHSEFIVFVHLKTTFEESSSNNGCKAVCRYLEHNSNSFMVFVGRSSIKRLTKKMILTRN